MGQGGVEEVSVLKNIAERFLQPFLGGDGFRDGRREWYFVCGHGFFLEQTEPKGPDGAYATTRLPGGLPPLRGAAVKGAAQEAQERVDGRFRFTAEHPQSTRFQADLGGDPEVLGTGSFREQAVQQIAKNTAAEAPETRVRPPDFTLIMD